MTSNQIAYAGVKVQEAALEETTRHNKATEALAEAQNRLNQEIAGNERQYKQDTIRLQEQRLNLEDQWNTRKITNEEEYQKRSNELRLMEAMITDRYNSENVRLGSERNEIERTRNEEVRRHNLQEEYFKNYGTYIENKELEFKKYQFDTDIAIKRRYLDIDMRRFEYDVLNMNRNYELGLMNIGIQQRRNNIEQQKFDWMKSTDSVRLDMDLQKQWYEEVFPRKLSKFMSLFN